MKKEYCIPEVSVVMFDNEDIITESATPQGLFDFQLGDSDVLWNDLFGDGMDS